MNEPDPNDRGTWASFRRWARLRRADWTAWPTTFRFPTDCTDPELLRVVVERAHRSAVIRELRLLPGRHGAIDIEVDVYENHEAGRARTELKAVLPPGISLIGGPTWGTGGGF